MKRLTDIFNSNKITKVFALAAVGFVFSFHSAFAFTQDYSDYCGFLANQREKTEIKENFDTAETKKKVEEVNRIEDKVKEFCKKLEKTVDNEIYRQQGFFKTREVEDFDSYNANFNKIIAANPDLQKEYNSLQNEYAKASLALNFAREADVNEHQRAIEAGEYQPCGPEIPRGCPSGTQCYKYRDTFAYSPGFQTYTTNLESKYRYKCLDPNSKEAQQRKYTQVKQGENTDQVTVYTSANALGARGYTVTITETGDKKIENLFKPKECNIEGMRRLYQTTCYSCIIIKTLMETFLNACSTAYDITSEAGVKLLVLGALVWMAFFVMKNVSSLSNIEPGAMMNTLTVFLFKVMVAYILITSGLGVLVKYTINPLLTAGADFGLAFTKVTSDISGAQDYEYTTKVSPVKVPTITTEGVSTEVVPAEVLNKVMLFAQNLDKNVSTNLVIGHAITCWSINGGAWNLVVFRMVNLWLWFCGALIWFVGFMLTLGIGYYLLDISFKLGFAIMALPVVIGLWPFNVTKGKVTAVISIMLKAAGTFVFLALTTTYALAMISTALRNVDTLLDKVQNKDAEWISETFDLTGPYFLIILFVYLYSMKLISSTVSDYVDKFFKDSVFGSADPMHGKLTQMTDFAKQQAMRPVKWAGGKASDAVKKQATEGAAKVGKFVRGLFKGKANGDQEKDNKGGGNPVSGGGTAIKNTGKGAKAAGATMEQSGKGVQAAGKGVEAGGKAAQAGGKGLMSAGKGLSATGLGAIVGVPMMIAGAAAYGAGKGAEVAGKVTQKAGKAMQKGGKAMKKAGEKMEKAGEKMEKMGNKLKFGDEKAPEPENKDNSSEGESSRPEEQNKSEKPDNGNKPENGK